MGLFTSSGRNHLIGHKELSKDTPVITLTPNEGTKVYFPTMTPNKKPIQYDVKPGDKVLVGQKIGCRTDFYVPIYSSVSGVVVESEKIFSAQIGAPIPHLTIEADGKQEAAEPLPVVSLESSKEEIFNAVKEAGIVGMGGAGFPLYVKYETTQPIDTLVVNGVECEPFITTDYVSTAEDTDSLVKGIKFLMKVSGAQKAIIAIKVHKEHAKEAIEKEIANESDITLREVPDAYPMGWEKFLIHTLLKRDYEKLPADCGCIVNNIQSVMSIGSTLSTGVPVTSRLVTVSGEVIANPGNVKCPLGMLAKNLVDACGGINFDGEVSLLPGGPMCSQSVTTLDFPILLQNGAITALKFKKIVSEPCLRCARCTAHCPAHLQPVELKKAYEAKDVDAMISLKAMSCVECGTCSYVCPSHIEVTDYVKRCKMLIKLKAPKK